MGGRHITGLVAKVPWAGPRAVYRLQHVGHGYPARDWPELVRTVNRHRPDVVSVDVFDTCLVRELVGDQVVEHITDQISDEIAGQIIGRPDDHSDENRHDGRGGESVRRSVAAELERRLCRPVPGVAESLELIRKSDVEVVFLSDTDRSSSLLVDILRSFGIFVEGDRLVASCEAGATKSDGDLFHDTWPPAENGHRSVWHVGNHPWSDVAMAAVAGVQPVPLIEADGNRYERAMAARQGSYGPAIAGSARLARLSIAAERRAGSLDERRTQIQTLGADVAGQTMTAFVLWVAERCRDEGIDHVGFLARDGELPLKIAEALPADHWDGRSLLYLHSSRLTWSLAAAAAVGVEQWMGEGTAYDDSFIHTYRHHIPLEALLARIGLGPADLADFPKHRWLAGLDPTAALPEFAVEDWEALLVDQSVLELVEARAGERLALIVDWLRAEKTPLGRYGLVDVGWRGRLASHISAVLSQVVGEDPIHFHFGGNKVIAEVDARIPIRRFAFDGVSDPHPIDFPVSCVETLTASGKRRVIDYRRLSDGHVEPVFDRPLGGDDGERDELWTGAARMAERVPCRADLMSWGLDPHSLADEAKAILDLWWNHPTREEVEAFDDLRFEHDEAGTTFRPLVAPYRMADLFRGSEQVVRQWPQGSAVVTSGPMAGVARTVWLGRRLKRRFRR